MEAIKTPEEILKDRFKFYDPDVYGKDVELNGETVMELMEQYASQFKPSPTAAVSGEEIEKMAATTYPMLSRSEFAFDKIRQFYSDYDQYKVAQDIKRSAFIASAIAGASSLPLWGEWVSVNDRLPENKQKVLFTVGGNENVRLGTFLKMDQWERTNMFCDGSFFSKESVGYWQPLPQPPLSRRHDIYSEKLNCIHTGLEGRAYIDKLIVVGEHNWEDGQRVIEGRDYELQYQWYTRVADRWDNCTEGAYNLIDHLPHRRILAIPISPSPSSSPSKGEGQSEIAWKYCPECGGEEIVNENLVGEGYRVCKNCGQEWWKDINYTDTVRRVLQKLRAVHQSPKGEAVGGEGKSAEEKLAQAIELIKGAMYYADNKGGWYMRATEFINEMT